MNKNADQQVPGVVPKNVSDPEGVPLPVNIVQSVDSDGLKKLMKKALEAYRAGGRLSKGVHKISVDTKLSENNQVLITGIDIERQTTCNASVCDKIKFQMSGLSRGVHVLQESRVDRYKFSISPITGAINPEIGHFFNEEKKSHTYHGTDQAAPIKKVAGFFIEDKQWETSEYEALSLSAPAMQELLKEELEYWTR